MSVLFSMNYLAIICGVVFIAFSFLLKFGNPWVRNSEKSRYTPESEAKYNRFAWICYLLLGVGLVFAGISYLPDFAYARLFQWIGILMAVIAAIAVMLLRRILVLNKRR